MANNKVKPEIEIELGGKKRKLVFDFNALCKLEEMTGKNALDGETWQQPRASDIRILLWAALLRNEPELTLEDTGAMLTISSLSQVTESLRQAFESASMPADESKSSQVKKNSSQPALPTG